MPSIPAAFTQWLSQLEARHLADLRVPEVTRALRALSSAYVQRRHKVATGATLDSAGKRAAFALFYAPLHFLTTYLVVDALGAATPPAAAIIDLGCGTGAAGAAWATAAGHSPTLLGIDRHPWAVDEARWTYRQLGLRGQARQGDLVRLPKIKAGTAVVAAYALNELPDSARSGLEGALIAAAGTGVRVLVLEPIARGVTPWWESTAARVTAAGGRVDEWRFPVELPPLLQLFDRAAGLNHRELTVRSLYLPG
jgi:protein-L-isoaspartate O-methyltransferase